MQLPGLTIGIIADDLTGSCDTALQFFRAGCQARVLLTSSTEENTAKLEKPDVWTVNTDSRHMDPPYAMASVRESVALLRDHYTVDHLYKKMDSTLRGHFTQECMAALDELGWDAAMVVPAYPQEGRITVGGYQLVHGIPVEQTDAGRDPQFPISQSHLPTLIAEDASSTMVGHIELSSVLRGAGPVLLEMSQQIQQGKKLVVVDACSNTDLEQVALAIEKIQKTYRVLPCGSAGLAQALSSHWSGYDSPDKHEPVLPVSPILMVIGSQTQLTYSQVSQLTNYYSPEGNGTSLQKVHLEPDNLLTTADVAILGKHIATSLDQYDIVVVTTPLRKDHLQPFQEEPEMTPEHVQEGLTAIIREALDICRTTQRPMPKLVLTGGETATHLCHALGKHHLKMVAEIEPSIPLLCDVSIPNNGSDSCSPLLSPQWIVTKSGNFGSPLALVNIVRYLKQHESNTRLAGMPDSP